MQSHNDVQLTRAMLLDLLKDLQERTFQVFGCQIRLFVHGGAVMVLHPLLSTCSARRTTRDIDYIRRTFGHEWRKMGVYDAEDRLQSCINATADSFHIGTDWMDASSDVALPFARDPRGNIYDPIYYDSKQPNNVEMNIIYSSPGLNLISVTMFWGVALKLVRYEKHDPTDIVAMLRLGTKLNGIKWTPQLMETWIKILCWPMGYSSYHPQRIDEFRDRIQSTVKLLENSSDDATSGECYAPVCMDRPSMHTLHEHPTQTLHSYSRSHALPRLQFLPVLSDTTLGPHRLEPRPLSPLSTPTLSPPMSTAPPYSVLSNIHAF